MRPAAICVARAAVARLDPSANDPALQEGWTIDGEAFRYVAKLYDLPIVGLRP